MMEETLKLCPFCGKQHELEIIHDMHWGPSSSIVCNRQVIFSAYSLAAKVSIVTHFNSRPIEDALQAENARLREALIEIRDLARTGLNPDFYPTEEYWLSHKVNQIAGMANAALQSKNDEVR